jgi:hypothetical protein
MRLRCVVAAAVMMMFSVQAGAEERPRPFADAQAERHDEESRDASDRDSRDRRDGHDRRRTETSPGSTWIVGTYEAEQAMLGGGASIVGQPDASDRLTGDLGGEASGRQAVTLTNAGDSLSFTVLSAHRGASAVVIRYSIPDAPNGGGQSGTLDLSIADAGGAVVLDTSLTLTSRYAWLYGGVQDNVKLYNSPANASLFGEPINPTHIYDEAQIKLNLALQAGYSLTLTKTANSSATSITIDFIELEVVPPPLSQPDGYLSITDASCGAIALDTRNTGSVFDGVDDSAYGSVFNAVIGINPHAVVTSQTQEKDYYTTDLQRDVLQDTVANPAARGLSLFDLADHNFQSLKTCIALAGSGGAYQGVWIPPGRFYVRGLLPLPNGAKLQGAGMWYSKFAAVDTATPATVTFNGVTGISGTSGNLVFGSLPAGSDSVRLSGFAMFGNVTQRDHVDAVAPIALLGIFTNSRFDSLWVEHYVVGANTHGNSSGNLFSNSRARNTLADGFDFFGSTTGSTMNHCHARSTGDDGFAVWSQSADPAQLASNNTISNSVAQLQWIGNGFSLYGGTNNALHHDNAFDTLRVSGVQISTNFVPAALPSTVSMSASASHINLYRCGGNGFNGQLGALVLGMKTESLNGITLSNINIYDPSYNGIDVRQIAAIAAGQSLGTFSNVALNDVQIFAAPACSIVRRLMRGSVQFNNVCSCAVPGGTAATCSVTNNSAATFQIAPNVCQRAACTGP